MAVAMAVAPAMLVGFLAGLFSFRVKNRWCAHCGATLRCPGGHEGGRWTTSN